MIILPCSSPELNPAIVRSFESAAWTLLHFFSPSSSLSLARLPQTPCLVAAGLTPRKRLPPYVRKHQHMTMSSAGRSHSYRRFKVRDGIRMHIQ